MQDINNFIIKHEKKILFFLVAVCLSYTIFFAVNTTTPNGQDTYWYMNLAKSLTSGDGYTFEGQYPHSQYPPGLPILLIPLFLIFGNMYIGGLIMIALFSVLTLLLTYKIGKLLSPLVAVIATILLLFHNLFVSFTTSILTEIPFAFFSLLGLYLFIKGFENKKYFVFAFPVIAFTCLIRYDGFLLIFPMIFYTFINRQKIKKLIFQDSFLIGIVSGSLILGAWFLRNFIAFGNPLYSSYTGYDFHLGFSSIYSFATLFFFTGFLFPIFALIGAYFIIREKNKIFTTLIIWFFSYLTIHSIWGFKLLRFYSEILPVISIFTAYGIIKISQKIKSKKKLFAVAVMLLIIFSQTFILFNQNIGIWSSTGIFKAINQYSPIKDVCEWANDNLPDDAVYMVSDYPAYSFYLNKPNIVNYNQGFNYLLSNQNNQQFYLIVDTHHAWITAPYLNSSQGNFTLNVQTNQGLPAKVFFETELVSEVYYNKPFLKQPVHNQSAYIVKILSMEIK